MYVSTWTILHKAREKLVWLRSILGTVPASQLEVRRDTGAWNSTASLGHCRSCVRVPVRNEARGRGQIMKEGQESDIQYIVSVCRYVSFSLRYLYLCHIVGLFTGLSWKLLILFSLLFWVNWYALSSLIQICTFFFIYLKKTFYFLLQLRHLRHLPRTPPWISEFCPRLQFKVSCWQRWNPELVTISEASLLLLILTLRSFNKLDLLLAIG